MDVSIQFFKQKAKKVLLPIYDEQEANALIRILIEHFAQLPIWQLSLSPQATFTQEASIAANQALNRLIAQEPIQYILGQAWFMGYTFMVNPYVLIPRPETEELVQWILDTNPPRPYPIQIMDIGTGSGCIPIGLYLEWTRRYPYVPSPKIYGLDVSNEALTIAQQNAKQLNAPIVYKQLDILQASNNDFQAIDLIVSNPPYVLESEKREMKPNVLEHEPHLALFVPDQNPLLFYKVIAQRALHWLKPKGQLFFEINEQMGSATKALLEDMGFEGVELQQDIYQKDRFCKGQKP